MKPSLTYTVQCLFDFGMQEAVQVLNEDSMLKTELQAVLRDLERLAVFAEVNASNGHCHC